VDWEGLGQEPALAASWPHVVALDPPALPRPEALAASLPGPGFAHLVWGAAETDFALAAARAEFDLRPALVAVYRALREAAGPEPAPEALARALRGDGRFARPARVCGRLLRVLCELGLARYVPLADGGPGWSLLQAERTDLDRSPAFRAYAERLRVAESCLGGRLSAAAAVA
jgi:hypothetical protein